MNFAFTEDQEMLRREARHYLSDRYPGSGEWDASSFKELAELGWTGISLPEELGGAGLGFLEEAVLFEELGRALYLGPYFATVGLALPALGPDQQSQVAGGKRTYTAALDGLPVPDGELVDEVVTVEDAALAERIRLRALAALSLEAVGIAQRALELGVEHAKTREQFGKPIGVYQAVSHKLADTYVETELARSLSYWAAWCVDQQDDQSQISVAAAKGYAGDAAVAACERAIQVHGGMGFTWEHVLHRYYKRALWIQAFGGYAQRHRADVARALLD
ncbi:MAG TPA: acyl-CoA dehydrogenase family protein [Acidimicrobiales bacterium]|nr:acyl-CoA dehydrogenase family protein [Acidimicrobiales bacterium]